MLQLTDWARRWGLPLDAMLELQKIFGIPLDESEHTGLSEQGIQSMIRMEAARLGARLWRNNVGATVTESGGYLRYGLANDSPQLNRVIKSADLIGIRPVAITQYHVGSTIGQFISREIKSATWKYTGTERELAQLRWAELITSLGGDARFANSEGTL